MLTPLTYAQRGASIDDAHLAPTTGVMSALFIEGAFYRMHHIVADTSDHHP